ncbi:methyltransferase domain-containing protein [Desulfolutivibrio sulfoxidireducens]|uniref:methyltransferase domain-containing protein n=1 Tax=Desulfolutivibrio sulfoxidireducens TaxID=2773299 RepID=UPI00210ED9DE|nr:methyltransferase domain-containing protein [Desulfolutivibrio sulfoxidireducens]
MPPTSPGRAAMASSDSLAGDFRGVDRARDPGRFVACLQLLAGIPFFRDYKKDSIQALGLAPGDTVLEVGCGLGRDLADMAERVGNAGLAVGLDASLVMLDRAGKAGAAGEKPGSGPVLIAGDAHLLPFADAAFSACRVDRTLQHAADPFRVLAEMARVTRPGGRVVAVEPDWGTFVLDSDSPQAARIVAGTWRDRFPSGTVGRFLARGLAEAGLAAVTVVPRTFVLRDFQTAEAIYDIEKTVAEAVGQGRLTAGQGREFLEEQRTADSRGNFFSSLTFFQARGVKPGVRDVGATLDPSAPRPHPEAGEVSGPLDGP